MAAGTLFAGTSGYAYKEWKGSFYPEKLAQTKFLEYYAERLPTVEINNTFYRFPSAKTLTDWQTRTPDTFRFAVKANQRITHLGRLQNVGEVTNDFAQRCNELGEKLGPILFQLPPNLKRDDERLDAFLQALPPGGLYTIEFRNKSWFDETVFDKLRSANVALCVSEDDKLQTPRTTTASFCYARLRRDDYDEDHVVAWRTWLADLLSAGQDAYVYLKHDDCGESPERVLNLLQS